MEHINLGNPGGQTCGRAFVIKAEEARQNAEVVTCTFIPNNHYASVLFDYGEDRSFVSHEFRPLIDLKSKILEHAYVVEVANGHEIKKYW